eukprot:gene2011-2474_t
MSKPGANEEAMKIAPEDTVFAKILKGTIPCKKVYEDEHCLSFDDISPVAPIHVVIIPKKAIGGAKDLKAEDSAIMGHIMTHAIHKVAEAKGIDSYRLVINEGPIAGQSVRWLHIHLIGGKALGWPPC